MKKIIDSFASITGNSFIGIGEYTSKGTGAISNYLLNVGIDIVKLKNDDLKSLKSVNSNFLTQISNDLEISFDTVNKAYTELIVTAEKNISKDIEFRTNQSKAQTNAYIGLTSNNSVRLHKDTLALHIFGVEVKKRVLVEGVKKVVKSQAKTIAKREIEKRLNLRRLKLRTFIFDNANSLSIKNQRFDLTNENVVVIS